MCSPSLYFWSDFDEPELTVTLFLMVLLVLMVIISQIKHLYDRWCRRRRAIVEMAEDMVFRPLVQIFVELKSKEHLDTSFIRIANEREEDFPSPIALEPCSCNTAAVLSLLVRLPTGGEAYVVREQAIGLAIGSVLVTHVDEPFGDEPLEDEPHEDEPLGDEPHEDE